jgi:threonine/homoserine/homoserine lactone efflux protein
MHDEWTAFVAVAAVVIVTPGQDTALTVRNTLLARTRMGLFTVLGSVSARLDGR